MTQNQLAEGINLNYSIEKITKFITEIEGSTFKALNKNDYSIPVPDEQFTTYLEFMGRAKSDYLQILKKTKEELEAKFEQL